MNRADALVLHDSFAFKGGGERLAEILCRGLRLDLAFGDYSEQSFDLKTLPGRCIDLKAKSGIPGWRTLKRFWAFGARTRFLKNYETVIYSGQNSVLAVYNHPSGKNIYYCNTPPRSVYDLKDFHLATLPKGQTPVHNAYNFIFRPWYEAAVDRMDVIVANSKNIQKRIKAFLNKDSQVVHPPCETEKFRWMGQEDYYLSTARLTPLKRVDTIIEAFLQMPDRRLILASSGPEYERFLALAEGKTNISFAGAVDDERLQQLMGHAIATVYIPREEDFGISPVESMAAGKPVLGVAEGGLLETVVHGETGILIPPNPSVEDVIHGIRELGSARAKEMRASCQQRAGLFSKQVFLEKMKALIEE